MAKKKLKRVVRRGRVSPAQAARDRDVRVKIENEFPPARDVLITNPISESLRRAIEESDKWAYQISKEAGVAPIVISRYLSGERDIRMATADRIADVLGLTLAQKV